MAAGIFASIARSSSTKGLTMTTLYKQHKTSAGSTELSRLTRWAYSLLSGPIQKQVS